MKKLLLPIVSIFVLVNIAFAQSAQEKIDRITQEYNAQQEKLDSLVRAKIDASYELNSSLKDGNPEREKAAKEKYDKTNKEISSTLDKLRDIAEAEVRARVENLEESDENLYKIYKKKFPEFESINIDEDILRYILWELNKDPNWDIINIYGHRARSVELVKVADNLTVIESTSGHKEFNTYNESLIKAFENRKNHKDPVNAYLIKEEQALQKMKKDVYKHYDFYYQPTGKKYDFSKIVELKCQTVVMSYKDIPADSCYYTKENKSDAYLNTFNKIKDNRIVFVKCINAPFDFVILTNYGSVT